MANPAVIAAGGVQIASSIGGLIADRKKRRLARKANQARRRIEAIQRQRERTVAIRQARIQRANAEAAAAGGSTSILSSSGVQGTIGSQTSQFNISRGVASSIEANNRAILAANQKIDEVNQRQAIFSAIGNLSGQTGSIAAS